MAAQLQQVQQKAEYFVAQVRFELLLLLDMAECSCAVAHRSNNKEDC